jgi:site-specific DNA-methyltransferase (adenine-specific)
MNPDVSTSGGQHVKDIQEDLKLASALEDPEIARIKDKKKALKALELKQKLQSNATAAAAVPRITHEDYKYKIADALEALTALPDGSIDILLSDPPYGRNFHKDELWSGQERNYDDSPESYKKLMTDLVKVLNKKLAPQAHVYLFCDIYYLNWLRELFAFNISKFESWRHPIIWDKGHMGSYANIEFGPRHVYDYIFYGYRGERKVANIDKDIISGILPLEDKRHPDEKPPEVFRNLINRSANAGDLIVDPFCGAGTIFIAGAGLQCRIFASELDPAHEVFIQQSITQAASFSGVRKL